MAFTGVCLTMLLLVGCKTMQVRRNELAFASEHDFREQCQAHLDSAHSLLGELVNHTNENSTADTLAAYNNILAELDVCASSASLISQVHPDAHVRQDAEDCQKETSRFSTELSLDKRVFTALTSVDKKKLDGEASRMLSKTLKDFERAGVNKSGDIRAEVKDLQDKLVGIGQDFERNIREDVRFIEVKPSVLKGLPSDYIAARPAAKNGLVRITTDYPDYIPFMTYADDSAARKELWLKFIGRAFPKNISVLKAMIDTRYALAKLLGYASYAELVTEDKMIKTPKHAREFIGEIAAMAKPIADKEYAVLLAAKRAMEPGAEVVFGYERAFLEEKVRRHNYALNSQELRPYFEANRVREGLLELTGDLFGVRYVKLTGEPVWHPSVMAYDVVNRDDSKRIGRIFLDLYPRADKFKHAAQFTIQSGIKGVRLPEGVLVCNFAEPKPDVPAFMDHDQVVTFFHEFGHLMHHIFGGQQKWVRFSGVATEWDFVEAPSQLFEEWAWNAKVLQRFAKHHESGEPIPATLVERMRAADEFGKGLDARQQMFFAALSLEYYDRNPSSFEPAGLLKELQAKYSAFPYVEGTNFQLNFGHLEGYSALYYTYMWSKVIAKDMFSAFEKEGLLNAKTALKYRQTVLDQGGAHDAEELVRHFLGRPYRFDAFRKWLLSSEGLKDKLKM
jgi:thimet oligopeptidase